MKYILEYRKLFENTLKQAKTEFLIKNLIDINTFNSIVARDVSPKKKYVYWIIKMYLKNTHQLNHIFDTIYWFDKNQKKMDVDKRDINKLNVEDIEKMQQDPKYMSNKDIKKMQKSSNNYEIVYEDLKGNKVVKILNRFGATYWTQLKTDKLEPASFCIGSYDNKEMYDLHMKPLTKKNGLYFIILPNEEKKYRKIVLTPSAADGIYDITDMDNNTQANVLYPPIFYSKATLKFTKQTGTAILDLNKHNDISFNYMKIFKKYIFINDNNIKSFNKFIEIINNIKRGNILKKTISYYDDIYSGLVNRYPNGFSWLSVGSAAFDGINDGYWDDLNSIDFNISFLYTEKEGGKIFTNKGFKNFTAFIKNQNLYLSKENGQIGKMIIKNLIGSNINKTLDIIDKYVHDN